MKKKYQAKHFFQEPKFKMIKTVKLNLKLVDHPSTCDARMLLLRDKIILEDKLEVKSQKVEH